MDVIFDQNLKQAVVTVKDRKIASQLVVKKSFRLLKSTGEYIMGLLDYEDLIFDFESDKKLEE